MSAITFWQSDYVERRLETSCEGNTTETITYHKEHANINSQFDLHYS